MVVAPVLNIPRQAQICRDSRNSSSSSNYPKAWSEWVWSDEHKRECRVREISKDEYEYDYRVGKGALSDNLATDSVNSYTVESAPQSSAPDPYPPGYAKVWSTWMWSDEHQREYRAREISQGVHEYEYRTLQSTPQYTVETSSSSHSRESEGKRDSQLSEPRRQTPAKYLPSSKQRQPASEYNTPPSKSDNFAPSPIGVSSHGFDHYVQEASSWDTHSVPPHYGDPTSSQFSDAVSRIPSPTKIDHLRAGETVDSTKYVAGAFFRSATEDLSDQTLSTPQDTKTATSQDQAYKPQWPALPNNDRSYTRSVDQLWNPIVNPAMPDSHDQSSLPSGPRHIVGTPGDSEPLDPKYRPRRHDYRTFFSEGRVFSTLWTDPISSKTTNSNQTFVSDTTYGEKVHTKIRRFVVVIQRDSYCNCLPVTSYEGRGTKKHGISLEEHSQIYSDRHPPKRVNGMSKKALRVLVSKGAPKIKDSSLVNYGRIYTVECNVKVMDIGTLDDYSRKLLLEYYHDDNFRSENYTRSHSLDRSSPGDLGDLAGVGASFEAKSQEYTSFDSSLVAVSNPNTNYNTLYSSHHPSTYGTQSLDWDSSERGTSSGGGYRTQAPYGSQSGVKQPPKPNFGSVPAYDMNHTSYIVPSVINPRYISSSTSIGGSRAPATLYYPSHILSTDTASKQSPPIPKSSTWVQYMSNARDNHDVRGESPSSPELYRESSNQGFQSAVDQDPKAPTWPLRQPSLSRQNNDREAIAFPAPVSRLFGGQEPSVDEIRPRYGDNVAKVERESEKGEGLRRGVIYDRSPGSPRRRPGDSYEPDPIEPYTWEIPSPTSSIASLAFSYPSTSHTQSSITSAADYPEQIRDRFIDLLNEDEDLQVLYSEAVQEIDLDRFEKIFRRCLEQMSAHLRSEASSTEEKQTARLIRRLSTNAAHIIRNRLQTEYGSNQTVDSKDNDDDNNDLASDAEDFIATDEIGDQVDPLEHLEQFVLSSASFMLLKESLRLFIHPNPSLLALSRAWPITQSRLTPLKLTYKAELEIFQFLKSHFPNGQKLGDVQTLTGDGVSAQALSCRKYMVDNWSEAGMQLLEALEQLLVKTEKDSTNVTVSVQTDQARMDLEVRLDKRSIIPADPPNTNEPTGSSPKTTACMTITAVHSVHAKMISSLSWLCAAIRSSPYSKLVYSSTSIEISKESGDRRAIAIRLNELQPFQTGIACWHSLFPHGVIAKGFPIKGRRQGKGLEISVSDMALLSHSLSAVEFDGGLIFEGLRTLLIPMRELSDDDALQWHLESKSDQKSRYGRSVRSILSHSGILKWHKELQLRRLIQKRCFLGWVEKASVIMGAESYSSTKIQFSGLPLGPNVKRVTSYGLTVGTGGMGFVTAEAEASRERVAMPSLLTLPINKDIYDTFADEADASILVYDVGHKIAWCLPLPSVVLYVLCAVLKRRKYGLFEGDREITLPYADPSPAGSDAALKVLRDSLNYGFRKHMSENEVVETPLSEIVRRIWQSLNIVRTGLESANVDFERVGEGPPRILQGVEFTDVLIMSESISIKQVVVNEPWSHLTFNPATSLPVLFCKGLGQPIAPAVQSSLCSSWEVVPSGKNYLVLLGRAVQEFLKQNDHAGEGSYLVEKVQWLHDKVLVRKHTEGQHEIFHMQRLNSVSKVALDKEIYKKLEPYVDACFVFARHKSAARCSTPLSTKSSIGHKYNPDIKPEPVTSGHVPDLPKSTSQTSADTESFDLNGPASESSSCPTSENPDQITLALAELWPVTLPKSERHAIPYEIEWEVQKFLGAYFKEGQQLGNVFTLTDDGRETQASSFHDFLSATWSDTGELLLEGLQKLLAKTASTIWLDTEKLELDENSSQNSLPFDNPINVQSEIATLSFPPQRKRQHAPYLDPDKLVDSEGQNFRSVVNMMVDASYKVHTELMSALSWVCAAIRYSPRTEIMLGSTSIQAIKSTNQTRIASFRVDKLESLQSQPACWHSLFPHSVIAKGFPIGPRKHGQGLDISFADMVLMSRSLTFIKYDGGLVVEGLGSLLIPIKILQDDDALQWHYESKRLPGSGERRSVSDIFSSMPNLEWYKKLEEDQLTSKRCFLGWVDKASIVMGTGDHVNFDIVRSGAAFIPKSRTVGSNSITLGTSSTGFVTFTGTRSWKKESTPSSLTFSNDRDIEEALADDFRVPITVYDDSTKIAWCLPQASVCLHLVHSLLGQRDCQVSDQGRTVTLASEATGSTTASGAKETLMRSLGFDVRIRSLGERSQSKPLSRTIAQVWLRLNKFRDGLKKAIGQLQDAGFHPPENLIGVEFADVSEMSCSEVDIKKLKLNQPWVHFVHQSAVLFCGGLGQPIIPIVPAPPKYLCCAWETVPMGEHHLVLTGDGILFFLSQQEKRSRLQTKVTWMQTQMLVLTHCRGETVAVYHTQRLKCVKLSLLDLELWERIQACKEACFVFSDSVPKRCISEGRCQESDGSSTSFESTNGSMGQSSVSNQDTEASDDPPRWVAADEEEDLREYTLADQSQQDKINRIVHRQLEQPRTLRRRKSFNLSEN